MINRSVKQSQRAVIIAALTGILFVSACQPAVTVPGTPAAVISTATVSVPKSVTITPLPTETPNLTPSATSALVAVMSLTPNLAPSVTSAPFVPQPGSPPPLTLTLPKNWRATYTRLPVVDQVGEAMVNIAAYAGPVSGEGQSSGTGFIYILWNYPSLAPINPGALPTSVADFQRQQLLGDAYRLLRGTVFDVSCTFGTYGHADFTIGKQTAVGQTFQTTACQDNSPDVVGWYAGLYQNGTGLLFYAYIQPVADYNLGRPDLQHLLDSVVFSTATPNPATLTIVPSVMPTGTPELN